MRMLSDCGAANVFFYQRLRTLTAHGLFLTVQTINVYIIVTQLSLRVTLNVCYDLVRFSSGKNNQIVLPVWNKNIYTLLVDGH